MFILAIAVIVSAIGILKPKRALLFALSATGAAFLLLRTYQFGYPPIFEPTDTVCLFMTLFSLSAALASAGRLAYLLNLIMAAFCVLTLKPPSPIPPVIRTPLFFIHVGSALAAYALLLSAAILYLPKFSQRLKLRAVVKLGFIMFSLSMLFGGVWAYLAWGDILPVEPKSLSSMFLWVYYGFILHLAYDDRLKKFEGLFTVLGGILVLLSFFAVNYLLGGTHAF